VEPNNTISQFKCGDTVKLVSGGPEMRVIGFSPNGRIWCDWESSSIEHREEGSFVPESLKETT
jgi:uncharacterized protein YodC (DUF2158 family)